MRRMMFFQEGSITTNALDIEAGINFANGGYITAADTFNITADSFTN